MNYSDYPELAGRTEGSYSYLRYIWTYGRCEEWLPSDGEPGISRDKLRQMRFQHAIIGINTETAEVSDLIAKPHAGEESTAEYGLEVAKELGDVMWYVVLMFRYLNGNDLNKLADRFSRVCESAQRIAYETQGNNILPLVWTCEMDQLANTLLKRLKNQMFYGSIPDEDRLIEWTTGIVLRVAQIGLQHGYPLNSILELNIDKLKRKFPNGFNGVDAETKRHETKQVEAQEKVETRVLTANHIQRAEIEGLVYPKPLGPDLANDLLSMIKSNDVVAVPITNDGLSALQAALNKPADEQIHAVLCDSAPPPNLPQADLAARIKDLSEFDVRTLEIAVDCIKAIHESDNPQHLVDLHNGVLKNMSAAVERLGWQPSEAPVPVIDGKSLMEQWRTEVARGDTTIGFSHWLEVMGHVKDTSGSLPQQPLS